MHMCPLLTGQILEQFTKGNYGNYLLLQVAHCTR